MWIASFIVLGLVFFGYLSITNRAFSAENSLEASYQRSFYDLTEKVNNINVLISKCMITSSNAQRIMTLTTIWHQAEGARENLSILPLGQRDMTNTQRFFAQLGDFSYTLSNKIVDGISISDEEWKKLKDFKKNTQKLNQELRQLQDKTISGKVQWESKPHRFFKKRYTTKAMADSLSAVDEKLKKEAPSIVYDGPFSEHMQNQPIKNIYGSPIVQSKANTIAKNFLKKTNINENISVDVTGKTQGKIPAFTVEGTSSGHEYVMDISQIGGHVLWFLCSRDIKNENITVKDAVEKARNFMKNIGFEDFETTGSLRERDSLIITFVPKQKQVLLYPDFIKVEVALDDGSIVAYDAMAYYTFHGTRKLPENLLSEKEIRKKINTNLTVNRTRLAIIPRPDGSESLCYEADIKFDNERYLVYINAKSGREEHILKVVETEKGTMTM